MTVSALRKTVRTCRFGDARLAAVFLERAAGIIAPSKARALFETLPG
jgi:hypothetical protein